LIIIIIESYTKNGIAINHIMRQASSSCSNSSWNTLLYLTRRLSKKQLLLR